MILEAPPATLTINKYFTDGKRLYRIVQVNKDWTCIVENCSTLFTHEISIDTIHQGWREVRR